MIASSSAEILPPAPRWSRRPGLEPLAVAGDLRKLADCEQLFAKVKERFGRCDILINKPGAPVPAISSNCPTMRSPTALR